MERDRVTFMDPRKGCVFFLISRRSLLLTPTGRPDFQRDLEKVLSGTCYRLSVCSWNIHAVDKLVYHSTGQDEMRSRTSPDGLLLL
jgi:hypothetical protein